MDPIIVDARSAARRWIAFVVRAGSPVPFDGSCRIFSAAACLSGSARHVSLNHYAAKVSRRTQIDPNTRTSVTKMF